MKRDLKPKNQAAAALGQIGGKKRSGPKSTAARANGTRGGRPRSIVLGHDVWAVGIHGVTGQPYEKGWIPAGSIVTQDSETLRLARELAAEGLTLEDNRHPDDPARVTVLYQGFRQEVALADVPDLYQSRGK